jgi:flagellar biosynthesis protein FliR
MGLRLALPIIALLAMTDITLSLLGRLNSQLHVTTLAFPAKMLAALGLLAWLAGLMPTIFQQYARQILTLIEHILRVSGG